MSYLWKDPSSCKIREPGWLARQPLHLRLGEMSDVPVLQDFLALVSSRGTVTDPRELMSLVV